MLRYVSTSFGEYLLVDRVKKRFQHGDHSLRGQTPVPEIEIEKFCRPVGLKYFLPGRQASLAVTVDAFGVAQEHDVMEVLVVPTHRLYWLANEIQVM